MLKKKVAPCVIVFIPNTHDVIIFVLFFQQRLLGWVKDKLPELPVNNFTSDWNDGRAVGALVDSVAPGLCPDWDDWDPKKPLENAKEAMDLADKWLNVPKLLAPEDIVNPSLDEQSMMTYLSQFPNAKLKPGAPLRQKTNPSKVRAYGPGMALPMTL